MVIKMTTEKLILMDVPMPIITPRLTIRPVMPGDGHEVNAAIGETWDDLHRWMIWAKERESVDTTEENVRRAYARFILREELRMVAIDRESGAMAVFTGFHGFDPDIRRIGLGYWTRKFFQNRGLATEATLALTHYAFQVLKARCVAIDHAEGNEASRCVIQRAGFVFEGCLKGDYLLPEGPVVDRLYYSHTDAEKVPPLDVRWGTQT